MFVRVIVSTTSGREDAIFNLNKLVFVENLARINQISIFFQDGAIHFVFEEGEKANVFYERMIALIINNECTDYEDLEIIKLN